MKRVALLVLIAACGGSKNGGGGSTTSDDPSAVVRGFVEAIAAGDLDRARSYLPDDDACVKAPAERVDQCKKSSAAMRAQIAKMSDDFPKGSKVTKVTREDEPSPDPTISMWEIELDGKPVGEMMSVEIGGKTYAAFPVRAADQ